MSAGPAWSKARFGSGTDLMPDFTSRVGCDAALADIAAEQATINGSFTYILALLTSEATRIATWRDLAYPQTTTDPSVLLIDCGGAGSGSWIADTDFVGGTAVVVSSSPIVRSAATSAPVVVLQSYRRDFSAYVIPSYPAGRVGVTIDAADVISNAPGQNVEDFKFNGALLIQGFDGRAISGAFGKDASREAIFDHPGGDMTVGATATAGSTFISGLRVRVATGETVTAVISPAPTVPTNAFLVESFPNTTLAGPAVYTATESASSVDFNLGTAAGWPGGPTSNWSQKRRGNFTFLAGDYVFSGNFDDGYELFVDGVSKGRVWGPNATTPYSITVTMTAGVHEVRWDYLQLGGIAVGSLAWAPSATPPPTSGTRVAGDWPFDSGSPANVSVGSGITVETNLQTKTAAFLAAGANTVNAGSFSHPVYKATLSDPVTLIDASGHNGNTMNVYIPLSAVPAGGTDKHMHVVQPDGYTLIEIYLAVRVGSGPGSHFTGSPTITDLRGGGYNTQGGGTRAWGGSAIFGLMRTTEVLAGLIPHAIGIAITTGTARSGFVFPAYAEDGSPNGYSGPDPMGEMLVIPAATSIAAYTGGALLLATALQDYGAYVIDTLGSGGATFYGEPGLEGTAQLASMRASLGSILSLMRVVTNNATSPTTGSIGGPGTRRRAAAPPFA